MQLLGVGAEAGELYLAMLRNPGLGVTGLSQSLAWPVQRVHEALDDLARLSLVRPSTQDPDGVRLVDPEGNLARLEFAMVRRQQELAAMRQALAQSRAAETVA